MGKAVRKDKYSDKFRDKNANNLKDLIGKIGMVTNIGSVKWYCGLRSYHNARSDGFNFINSRFHKKNLASTHSKRPQ